MRTRGGYLVTERVVALLAPVIVIAIATYYVIHVFTIDIEGERNDICAELLRGKVEGQIGNAGYFGLEYVFIGVDGADPDPALLRRLNNRYLEVKPISRCYVKETDMSMWMSITVRDRETCGRGVILSVNSIERIDHSSVRVEYGCFAGPLYGVCMFYIMEKEYGRWRLKCIDSTFGAIVF